MIDRSAQLWSAAALTKGPETDDKMTASSEEGSYPLENCSDKNETRYPYVTLHKTQIKIIKNFQIRPAGLK